MEAGTHVKTTQHQIAAYWPTLGGSRDFAMAGKIGTWVSSNEKVLNKKSQCELVKLLSDQFPELTLLETKDFAGRAARWAK
jgi:hypothetical protein